MTPRSAGGPRSGLPRASGRKVPRTDSSPAIQAPAHPAGRRICCWKRWRVSAHRGPRQLARRPNAASDAVAGRQHGRFASVNSPRDSVRDVSRCAERSSGAYGHGHGHGHGHARTHARTHAREAGCSCAKPNSAAFGRRRGCRGPRWAETRNASHQTVSPAAGWVGAWIAGELSVRGTLRPLALGSPERGPPALRGVIKATGPSETSPRRQGEPESRAPAQPAASDHAPPGRQTRSV